MNKKVTFKDIADRTGFSKTTISRYFNNPQYLTEKNRLKIATALEELNYTENKVAQILARGKTEYIGLIIPHMFMSFYSYMLDGFLRTYENYDYKFLVFSGSADPGAERKYISELLSYQVEGLIVLSHMIPSEELAAYEIPLVVVEREDRYVSSVNTDNYSGGVLATSLLIDNHCDVCFYISTDSHPEVPGYQRYKGFSDICGQNGMPCEAFFRDSVYTFTAMQQFAEEVLEIIRQKYKGKRKGIFCSNDVLADIILNKLFRDHGCLPEDFRIIGFDGSPVAEAAVLPISSVGQQVDVMVREAMEILDHQIKLRKEGKLTGLPPEHRQVPPQLLIRETSLPERG